MVWTPTWVTSRAAIGAFQARVIRQDREGGPSLEGIHAYANTSAIEALMLDRFVAKQAARELMRIYLSPQPVGMTVPIHWTSLPPKWRECIRLPFEDCPVQARRKFLKIEIFGLSERVPSNILYGLTQPLEKLGCDVIARLPLANPELASCLPSVRAVGVDLAELTETDRVGDDELFERLDNFRRVAREAHLAYYVWGLRRRPLISKVVQAGFSLVNGPGVMADLARPIRPAVKKMSA
jgi:hypothetical protein